MATKKIAPKKSTNKKAAAPKKAAPKVAPKVAPKKVKPAAKPAAKPAPKKAAAKPVKKAAPPKKAAPKATPKAAPKAIVKKAAVKKAVVKKAAPKKPQAPAKKIAPKGKPSKASVMQSSAMSKHFASREEALQTIRQILLQQKDSLLNEAESTINVLPEQTVFPDVGDQASAEIDRNFLLRLRGREQRLINKIEEAIERIDAGNFGMCEACGEEIGIKRLVVRPVATLCVACKEEQEEEERLQGQ